MADPLVDLITDTMNEVDESNMGPDKWEIRFVADRLREAGVTLPDEWEPFGVVIDGHEYVPEAIYQDHLPMGVPSDTSMVRVFIRREAHE